MMTKSNQSIILVYISHIDRAVQNFVDKIFPQNLTARYIIGLAIIGAMSLTGHLVIQFSLFKLETDERMIRLIQAQSDSSERFYREIIHTQTISSQNDFRRQIEMLDGDIANLIAQQKEIITGMDSTYFHLIHFPHELDGFRNSIAEAFGQLGTVFGQLYDLQYFADPMMRLNDPLFISFIRAENHYRDLLDQLTRKYEKSTHGAVTYFERLEETLMLLTLLILVLEAFYVFRPAVRRVYSAIQLRTEFLSRMSHEIRNPMNSIIGMTQLLGKTGTNQQQRSYIKILENSSVGLLEILNNLLDFSAIEAGKMKIENISIDIYDVIEKAVDLVTMKIQEKNLEFILYIAPNVPLRANSDPVRLQQVLVNLLSNAAKFTERGFIQLKVDTKTTGNNKYIRFSVIDSGIGIDDSKINSIFESFVQENSSVKRKYGGTGLGLAIAREIVQLFGGTLNVETKKDFGSTFSFTLPFKSLEASKTLNESIPIKLDNKKYILIDQNERSLNVMRENLETNGAACSIFLEPPSFDELSVHINDRSIDKIIIDAKTFGTKLEDLFIHMKQNKISFSKLCIVFGYMHTGYLFSLLNGFGITSFFSKPIKPREFINYLSGYTQDINQQENEDDKTELISERRYKILIAEDSADNRLLMQMFLEKYPVEPFFAENGKVAVDLFGQQNFDIIFMDIQMPEMNGITATKIIRDIIKSEEKENIPILAFTAHKPEEIFNFGEEKLFNDFVLKPITTQKLQQKIKQYLKFTERPKTSAPKPNPLDVSDLIPSYLERRTLELVQLNESMARQDLKTIARIGHQLKGSAKSYGFEELGTLGDELEKMSQGGQLESIKSLISKISDKISEYRKIHLN